MFKDGKKIFEIHGVYSAPSFDFREKLTSMLESAVGYSYPDFNDKGIITTDEVTDLVYDNSNVYKLFIASPAEEPLTLVTELMETLHDDNAKDYNIIFTYISEFKGEEFSTQQLESLDKIGNIVIQLGGKCIKSNGIEMLAGTINTITNFT